MNNYFWAKVDDLGTVTAAVYQEAHQIYEALTNSDATAVYGPFTADSLEQAASLATDVFEQVASDPNHAELPY